ncbi:thiamine phosphate synthase [Rhodobacteraceae bacterium XHP0102]|nr:thiamine phosphate synthase [Rhodobacteraceae bacterium XHP0102]
MALKQMALEPATLRLYLVTDPDLCPGPSLLDTVAAAVRGGVTFVQLRAKTASSRARVEMALALKPILQKTRTPFVINDDIEAAIAADVDGVHIGQEDIAPDLARARLGRGKIIGLSCETPEQVAAADPTLVDYLGLGPVFATATKTDHKPAIGMTGLAEMAGAAALPSVAIGGLKAHHARGAIEAGCAGVAVVSAICGQPDPNQAALRFIQAMEGASHD